MKTNVRALLSSWSASRQIHRADRAARQSLERELASYSSPSDFNDLYAMLERYSMEETADIRRALPVPAYSEAAPMLGGQQIPLRARG